MKDGHYIGLHTQMKMICCHCKKEKHATEFYRDRSRPSGRRPRCKICEKEYKDYIKRREYEKQYRMKNPEKRRKILASYYKENKEKHHSQQKIYRTTDNFKINQKRHNATRRARIAIAYKEDVNYIEIYNKAKGLCFYCGKEVSIKEAEFDHYIPLARGGLHEKSNMRCSCQFCNRSKGALLPSEWEVSHQMV